MIDAAGRRILIVEDEMMIAQIVADILRDLGHDVVGIAATVEEALAMIAAEAQAIDAATVDINLAGTRSDEVVEALVAHKIPLVVITGSLSEPIPGFEERLVVYKPFLPEQFEQAFQSLEFRRAEPY